MPCWSNSPASRGANFSWVLTTKQMKCHQKRAEILTECSINFSWFMGNVVFILRENSAHTVHYLIKQWYLNDIWSLTWLVSWPSNILVWRERQEEKPMQTGSEEESTRESWIEGEGGAVAGRSITAASKPKSYQFMLLNSSRRLLKAGGGAGQHACLPLMRDNFKSSVAGVTW